MRGSFPRLDLSDLGWLYGRRGLASLYTYE